MTTDELMIFSKILFAISVTLAIAAAVYYKVFDVGRTWRLIRGKKTDAVELREEYLETTKQLKRSDTQTVPLDTKLLSVVILCILITGVFPITANAAEVTPYTEGSSYDLGRIADIINKKYIRYEDMEDLNIREETVSKISEFDICVCKNDYPVTAIMIVDRQEITDKITDKIRAYYSVLEYGDDNSGFEYDYTIYKEAFMDEGVYSIILYSRDTLGNEACTQFAFIIDNTPPCVVADGIGEEGLLPEEGSKVNVYVNDNFKLDEAYFNVVNGRGEVIECYDYIRFAENEWDVMTITVPSGEAPLSLMYNVKDAAGNGIRTIYEDKVPMSDSTTRYDYIIDDSQKLSPWFGAALCLVVVLFLVCFFVFTKVCIKVNFHLKSLYKCIIVDIVK